ncbi:MAG: NAD(P)-binding domain-containing protein [Pseudonocardiaceae bacterium]
MSTSTDYLVIGAGPGGLQLGYFLQQAGRDYLILEAGPTAGTFFRTFPRHRQLISINKTHTGVADPEFNLRMDWNSLLGDDPDLLFTSYTERYFPHADDMVRYLGDFAAAMGLRVRYRTQVTEIREDTDGTFQVTAADGAEYRALRLIVATGPAKSYLPTIPGLETAERYGTVSVDPQDFTDQRVLIIGKGNSGFETAENLIETAAVIHVAGPGSIRMSWQSHFVGHLRAVNNNFLDTYQLKSQNALLDGNILRIERDPDGYRVTVSFSRADEVTKDIRYDRVIVCTGFRFDHSVFAANCRPMLVINDRFPEQTSAWESVNIIGLYFAGTLMQVRDFKRSTSGFIHGFRYCIRALHRILDAALPQHRMAAPGARRDPGSAGEHVAEPGEPDLCVVAAVRPALRPRAARPRRWSGVPPGTAGRLHPRERFRHEHELSDDDPGIRSRSRQGRSVRHLGSPGRAERRRGCTRCCLPPSGHSSLPRWAIAVRAPCRGEPGE